MAKFYGKIGYGVTIDKGDGIFETEIVEREYYGDLLKNYKTTQNQDINQDINISNSLSIIADPYAYENFHNIVYVTFMGTKWCVTNVNVEEYPRITLNLGGVYNDIG